VLARGWQIGLLRLDPSMGNLGGRGMKVIAVKLLGQSSGNCRKPLGPL